MSEPKYLTSPGHAIAMRKRWENRLIEQMQYVAEESPNARWGTLVRKMIRDINDLPPWSHRLLQNASIHEDPVDEIDRLGRTIATASYNTHVLARLAEEGMPYKQWLTRHDPKVRPTHRAVDGQRQPLSRPFNLEGGQLQYPGHSATAPIALWFGCRCMVIGRS